MSPRSSGTHHQGTPQTATSHPELTAIRSMLDDPASIDQATGLPGMVEARRCGSHLLRYLNDTGATGFFALINIKDIHRSYVYGGADADIRCWQQVIELITAELPAESYVARVSAGLVIHAWGEDVSEVMLEALGQVRTRLAKSTFSLSTDSNAIRIHLSFQIGYLVYPTDCGAIDRFSEITRLVALSCLDANTVHKTSSMRRYRAELAHEIEMLRHLEERAQRAIHAEHFRLHFQPKVCLATREVIGAEALARWTDEELGEVAPRTFVPVIEQSPNIVPFTALTIDQTVAFLSRQQSALPTGFRCSVNISKRIFDYTQTDLVTMIASTLERHRCPPELLEVEITESAYFSRDASERVVQDLKRLHAMGVTIAIDDFGSGYGALSLITSSVASVIKIDKELSDRLLMPASGTTFLRCLLYSAREAGIPIVVEGIEETWQEKRLLELQVAYGQGNLYAVALSEGDFMAYLSS